MPEQIPEQVSLTFALDVEDDWPPVASECLPFARVDDGYRLLVAPLFVKDLSVGDVLACTFVGETHEVQSWRHVAKSDRSTYWLLGHVDNEALPDGLARLRALGCNTASGEQLGVHSVDVPADIDIEAVDEILDELEEAGVPVACPSDRDPD